MAQHQFPQSIAAPGKDEVVRRGIVGKRVVANGIGYDRKHRPHSRLRAPQFSPCRQVGALNGSGAARPKKLGGVVGIEGIEVADLGTLTTRHPQDLPFVDVKRFSAVLWDVDFGSPGPGFLARQILVEFRRVVGCIRDKHKSYLSFGGIGFIYKSM